MEKAIHGKYVEQTYCSNCHQPKFCVQLMVNQCTAKLYMCGDCLEELKSPLQHPNAYKPLTPEELIKLQKEKAAQEKAK